MIRVHQKLCRTKELNEDGSQLSNFDSRTKDFTNCGIPYKAVIVQSQKNLATFEAQRSRILNRAELEFGRNQARALSQDEQSQFSQRALAELEVDSIALSESIKSVEMELESWGTLQSENELFIDLKKSFLIPSDARIILAKNIQKRAGHRSSTR